MSLGVMKPSLIERRLVMVLISRVAMVRQSVAMQSWWVSEQLRERDGSNVPRTFEIF